MQNITLYTIYYYNTIIFSISEVVFCWALIIQSPIHLHSLRDTHPSTAVLDWRSIQHHAPRDHHHSYTLDDHFRVARTKLSVSAHASVAVYGAPNPSIMLVYCSVWPALYFPFYDAGRKKWQNNIDMNKSNEELE